MGCQSSPRVSYGDPNTSSATFSRQDLGLRAQLLEQHNIARRSHGKSAPSLRIDAHLEAVAQRHAAWMARENTMSHTGENGSSYIERVGVRGWMGLGENVAFGQTGAEEVVATWMGSPSHRKNILEKRFKLVGFGIARNEAGTIYWCTVFGARTNP